VSTLMLAMAIYTLVNAVSAAELIDYRIILRLRGGFSGVNARRIYALPWFRLERERATLDELLLSERTETSNKLTD
jgi:hypothetical protein